MEQKRPRGRPKKEVSERLPQFSIRLPPFVKLGLHFLARARGVSLSAAVQGAVTSAMRTEKFEGRSISDVLRDARGPDHKVKLPSYQANQDWAERALESPAILISILPDGMRTPEENFFVDVVLKLGVRTREGFREFARDSDLADELWTHCRVAFGSGRTPAEAAEDWKEMMDSLPPP